MFSYPTEIQPPQYFTDAANVKCHLEARLDPLTQVDTAPAYHPVFRQIGAFLAPGIDLYLLLAAERSWTPGVCGIGQTGQAVFIVPMHPIAQCLQIHRTGPCRDGSGMAIHHHREGQQPSGNAGIFRPSRFRPEVRGCQIAAGDRYSCHGNLGDLWDPQARVVT